MSVTPGSASKLNKLTGVSKIISVTAAEVTSLKDRVFEAGLLMKFSDGKLYLTDGTTKLENLTPIVDQVLTEAEKTALNAAFSTGTYVQAAGGVVVHNSSNKIADSSLSVVEQKTDADHYTIVESYLSEYVTDGMIRIDKLPLAARAGVSYYADYNTMVSDATDNQKNGAFFVIDASGDSTVTSGSAMYVWVPAQGTSGEDDYVAAHFQKIAEVESLDINVDASLVSYTNVNAAGAVMYDHTVMLDSPTLDELADLIDASEE